MPGDKPNYLSKIGNLGADYIIIDLEDAVSLNNKQSGYALVLELKFNQNMFIRIPFFDNCYTDNQLRELILKFEGQIVLPKINSLQDIDKVIALSDGVCLNMIVLIENPTSFISAEEILKTYSSQIHAIGFGSHDFCSITGIKHTLEHLSHYKRQLILYAKAFGVRFIDGVDLDITNFDQFRKECAFAFEAGADGKFMIHPAQLAEFSKIEFMSDDELSEINAVYLKVKDIPLEDIEVYTIGGRVYEKPHIARIKRIMQGMEVNSRNLKQ